MELSYNIEPRRIVSDVAIAISTMIINYYTIYAEYIFKGGVFLTITATIVIVLSRKYTPYSNIQQHQQQHKYSKLKIPKQLEMVKNNNFNEIDYFVTPSTMETIRYVYVYIYYE